MSNADKRIDPKEKTSPPSRSNVEHTSESEQIKQEDLEKLSQGGFTEPGRPRSGERDATSGTDPLAPGAAGKATP
jgi:hypothetical protein